MNQNFNGLNHSNQKIVVYVGFDALEDFIFYDYILCLVIR